MNYIESENQRRLHNTIAFATVEKLDWKKKKFRAKRGEILTNWLEMPAENSGIKKVWRPLKKGSQVILASASGDFNNAVVIGYLWDKLNKVPEIALEKLEHCEIVEFTDGARLEINPKEKTLNFSSAWQINIQAQALNIEANSLTWNNKTIKTV